MGFPKLSLSLLPHTIAIISNNWLDGSEFAKLSESSSVIWTSIR